MRGIVVAGLLLLVAGCGSRSTDDWVRQLADADVVKRRQAIRELGARGTDAPRVISALTGALRDESEYVRRDAATTLGKFGPAAQEGVPALMVALKDRHRPVRTAAALALKRIDTRAAARAGLR